VCIESDKLDELYHTALEKSSDTERSGFLDAACKGNPTLRARIDALLQANEEAGEFLRLRPPFQGTHLTWPAEERLGTLIGPYKLLEKIGEGGMAVVYMAEQEQPIRRKVALKIIKLGMDTKQVIARFEAERQALALMDHPNIAKVLDAGATETGRPYFVMELVTGVSITEYCDKNKLSTKDRLALFIQVCNAVQHAHQKGIIHRDLKPTNIMITQHEGQPVPKVIDFGIAKATNQRLTEKTLFTRYAHIIGTPAYMSPEQAELSDIDIDTRSDIYSLGVLLYELLTGTTPFSDEELRKVGYAEMTRIIREQEPLRPSTRLTQMQAQTSCQIRNPKSKIENDLDWIVMKSLEKTRNRRYDNASALAQDLQRHINDEPVSARAPSAIYQLKKFLRRHRSGAVVALALSVAVVAFVVVLLRANYKEKQWRRDESTRHWQALGDAEHSFINGDIAKPLAAVKRLRSSPHVGSEVRLLERLILARVREKVDSYTAEIQADPNNAKLYFLRGRHYALLGESQKEHADLAQYAAIADREENTLLQLNTATRLGPAVNSSDNEWMPRLSHDGLALHFQRNYESAVQGCVAMRATQQDSWNPATRYPEEADLAELVAAFGIIPGEMPSDGRECYYMDVRPEGFGCSDIYVFTQDPTNGAWTGPVNLGDGVNSPAYEMMPSISPDGLELYFSDHQAPFRPGGYGNGDLWVTRRLTRDAPWQEPVNLGPRVNSGGADKRIHISADGLLLLFDSRREGGYGGTDIYMTQRKTLKDPWGETVNLGPVVNTPDSEFNPGISPDGRMLYFVRNNDIWQAPIVTEGGGLRTEN